MNRIVILEGPDGAGKTNLAKHLVKWHGFQYRHEGPPPPGKNMLEHYARKLLAGLRGHTSVVWDRFHIGETIYGPVARGVDRLGSTKGLRLMKRLIRAHDVRVLICLPEYTTCLANWKEDLAQDNDYLRNEARFHEVYYRYKGLTAYYKQYGYGNGIDHWNDCLNYLLDARVGPILPLGVIGNPDADTLIVGEQVNHHNLDLPFFSLGNSSGFLNDALDEAGFAESKIALTNALTVKGEKRRMDKVLRHLPKVKTVIAFGRTAQRSLKEHGINHWEMMHPSCFKRFHHKDRTKFIHDLEKIRRVDVDPS